MQISMNQLFDSNYATLIRYYPVFEESSEQFIYTKVMKAYYQNDIFLLDKIASNISNKFLKEFCRFRMKMITRELSEKDVEKSFVHGISEKWKGEISFCKGLALYRLGSYEKAQVFFLVAYKEYQKFGVPRKSLLSLSNAIIMEGNIDNQNRLLSDYIKLAQMAHEIEAVDTYANTCMNISDEFFKVGAVKLAFEYINKCINSLKNQPRSHQLNEAETMLVEILFTLKRNQEAEQLLKELEQVGNDETLEALKVVELRHKAKNKSFVDLNKLTPPWRQKYKFGKVDCLGDVSNHLIKLLAVEPVRKEFLLEELYPGVDIGDADNRLTTLISRINKVQKPFIEWNNGKYQLTHNESVFRKIDEKV